MIAACTCPELAEQNVFPDDVSKRAKKILSGIRNSIGCYSDSQGIASIRKNVAKYIQRRDGYAADPENIFITNGASSGIKVCRVESFVDND